MHSIDWSILAALIVVICVMAYRTKKYTRSVADFLAANRCAGKYLLGVADGIAGLGAVSIIALFEMHYKAGFTAVWWATLTTIGWVAVALTGWVQYRYRETRAMTMAQFFEMRYSRRFRVFAGFLAFFSGAINFGIFPAVGGRFFQYYCGLPNWIVMCGPFEIDLVYAAIMFVLLAISLAFTLVGGQIAVMVTDFIQGVFCNVMFVVLAVYLLWKFNWSVLAEGMAYAPENASFINPMKTSETDSYDIWYFLIMLFGIFFTFMAWQGNQGYFCAAKSPHEAMMGRVIAQLRMIVQTLPLALLPVCAFVFLHHPEFITGAEKANGVLEAVGNDQIRSQLTVSVTISHILPVGLLGGFAAMMFGAFVSTHDTYLHAWGSIFIQDVFLPIRQTLRGDNQPLSPRAHIRLLRQSILGVAVFIFLFSLLFNQKQDILMFFALTGTIFLGWSGAAIVGGLYWKRGTTAGAWTAALFGIAMAVVGWYMTYFWGSCQQMMAGFAPSIWADILERWPEFAGGETGEKCPINAQILWFYTMLLSAIAYAVVSLLTSPKQGIDMDRLLHRGTYAVESKAIVAKKVPTGLKIFRFGNDFTLGDKILYLISYVYVFVFFTIFLVGTLYALRYDIADASWIALWKVYAWVMLVIMVILTLWLAIGGFRDFRELLRLLRVADRDATDDGSVAEKQ